MLDPQIYSLLAELGFKPATVDAMMSGLIYLTLATVLAAIPTGIIAARKGRSAARWVVFALCIPALPLLLVAVLQKIKKGSSPPSGI